MEVLNSQTPLKTEVNTTYKMPECPKGLYEFEYDLEGYEDTLMCHIEVEEAVVGAREYGTGLQLEPDYDARINVFSVFDKGIEITDNLTEAQLEEIGIAYAIHKYD